MRAYALSLERDPVRADDLVQETMVRALANQDKFLMETSLRAWLFTILKNHFLSMTAVGAGRWRTWTDRSPSGFPSTRTRMTKVSCGELMSALQCLRKDERDVLLMVGIDGLSYEEAASTMGCAIGTIKSRVNRARHRLAHHMGLTRGRVWSAEAASEDARIGGGQKRLGDPGRARTCDLLLRRQLLYPAELRGPETPWAGSRPPRHVNGSKDRRG